MRCLPLANLRQQSHWHFLLSPAVTQKTSCTLKRAIILGWKEPGYSREWEREREREREREIKGVGGRVKEIAGERKREVSKEDIEKRDKK